jgi:hypothetical protein
MDEFLNCILPSLLIILIAASIIVFLAVIISAIFILFPALLSIATATAIVGLPFWAAVLVLLSPLIGSFFSAVLGSIALAIAFCISGEFSSVGRSGILISKQWEPILVMSIGYGSISLLFRSGNKNKS